MPICLQRAHLPCGSALSKRDIRPYNVSALRFSSPESVSRQGRCECNSNRTRAVRSRRGCQQRALQRKPVCAVAQTAIDISTFVQESRNKRLELLERQALETLKICVENSEHPVFPCALIAGDVVILELLSKLDYLKTSRVSVAFVDTFHLFPETITFLRQLEGKYGFKAKEFHAADSTDVKDFRAKHGRDLYMTDIDEYDRICKVEPFNRALKTLQCDVMINGRRRDHGFERAHLEVLEEGSPIKCNPLAWWEFKDCWDYIHKHGLQYHPLHDEDFPSIGDLHSTVPVPREKWFEYAGERSGRFQGLTNKDGSVKTECGIHVAGDDEESGMSNIRK
ncbi:hypothetical protein ABBQ38_010352 [Trebouxia sp. C0009 RCD-2024]